MVELREIDGLHLALLRGGGPAFRQAVAGVLGAAPPETPNSVADERLFWLGPDEWLAVTEEDVCPALEAALAGAHIAIVDVSEARALFELSGPGAPDVLASGCRLDLERLRPGGCAQTMLARAQVLLEPRAGGAWRIFVGRSFSAYLRAWLEDAIALQAAGER